MKRIIYLLALLGLVSSCDKRADYLELGNEQPLLELSSQNNAWSLDNTYKTVLVDSIKIGYPYELSYRITDEQINNDLSYSAVGVSVNTTGGDLNYDDSDLDKTGSLTVNTTSYGNKTCVLTAEDGFGTTASATLELMSFYNLDPVAQFFVQRTDILSDYEIMIDASSSFDKDQLYGGEVSYYQFIIDSDTTNFPDPTMYYSFPGPTFGAVIGVRVKDNSGGWSTINTITYNIP